MGTATAAAVVVVVVVVEVEVAGTKSSEVGSLDDSILPQNKLFAVDKGCSVEGERITAMATGR